MYIQAKQCINTGDKILIYTSCVYVKSSLFREPEWGNSYQEGKKMVIRNLYVIFLFDFDFEAVA